MSTNATFPAVELDKPRLNRWLSYMEEETNADPRRAESPVSRACLSLDLDRVEKLLNQLEVQSLAPLHYQYTPRPQPRRGVPQKASFFSRLFALWLSSLLLALGYMGFNDFERNPGFNKGPVAPKSTLSNVSSPTKPKLANSLNQLANALATSSRTLDQLEKEMRLSRNSRPRAVGLPTEGTQTDVSKNAQTPAAVTVQ